MDICYDEEKGIWDVYKPYATIDVTTEEDYKKLQAAIENQNAVEWINVEDKLPDEFQKVLVWRKTIGYDIAWIGFGSWIYDNLIEDIEVVAWMPLPEPPRMEGE